MSIRYINAEGKLRADIAFVGEAPGSEEEILDRPFVGKSGKVLNEWIKYLGYKREDCYITNVVKVRPPNNRKPTPDEIFHWRPSLIEELFKVKPKFIVTLGSTATEALLGDKFTTLTEDKGKLHINSHNNFRIFPLWHPAYASRFPKAEAEVIKDLKKLKGYLKV